MGFANGHDVPSHRKWFLTWLSHSYTTNKKKTRKISDCTRYFWSQILKNWTIPYYIDIELEIHNFFFASFFYFYIFLFKLKYHVSFIYFHFVFIFVHITWGGNKMLYVFFVAFLLYLLNKKYIRAIGIKTEYYLNGFRDFCSFYTLFNILKLRVRDMNKIGYLSILEWFDG